MPTKKKTLQVEVGRKHEPEEIKKAYGPICQGVEAKKTVSGQKTGSK